DRKRGGELARQALSTALVVALEARKKDEWQQVVAALEPPLRALGTQPHADRKVAEELLAQARDELRKRAPAPGTAEPPVKPEATADRKEQPPAIAKVDTPSAPALPATPEERAAKALALVGKIRAAADVLRQAKSAEDDVRRLEAAVKLNERAADAARSDRSRTAADRQAMANAAAEAAAQAQEKLGQAQQRLGGAQRDAANARQSIADAKKEFDSLTRGLADLPLKECQAAFVLALREIPAPEADKLYQLAQNCLANQERDKARTMLEKLIADYPDSRAADKARKALEEMKR
ncbi:MAG: hypothetical protein NTW87_23650, partial [Planctomycetota bacterium]|nr:hypothetical protein [Planctomycetota bacterium]